MTEIVNFVYVTMDGGQDAALREAARLLKAEYDINMALSLYSLPTLRQPEDWKRIEKDINRADFVFGAMIFGEEHVRPLQKILQGSDTPTCFITSNPALIYCNRMGKLDMSSFAQNDEQEEPGLFKRWMQKLRPKKDGKSEGYRQTTLIKNLTKLMKYVPGKVRDLHTFIAAHDYWIHSSPENLKRMMGMLIHRYVDGYEKIVPVVDAIQYPDMAIYHPDAPAPFESISDYAQWRKDNGLPLSATNEDSNGAVGILTMRAIVLSQNTRPLDTMIREIEAQGLEARVVYSAMLDFRPAIESFLKANGELAPVNLLMNAMGFPLVGGPAGSRPDQAITALTDADVAYFDMIPLGFQSVEEWQADEMGLNPLQVAMNIALPELDGSAEPVIYGGPTLESDKFNALNPELALSARRIARRVRLIKKQNAEKKVSIVLFNFPPTLGNIGTAAFLDVFASLYELLKTLHADGYQFELPENIDALRDSIVNGNAMQFGTDGNVAATLPLDEYRNLFQWHTDIEPFWGYAPGEFLNNGKEFYILGINLGNVFVGIQPGFGYERDPMRMLMGKDAAPHHGFAAFYTWLEHIYDTDAVVHLGTHGALEFMPGKQTGVSANCWPSRLLGSLPNFYYYCVNNPSEGSIAKRRSAATLVSYMVPPLQQAGLYKGLRRLKDSIETYTRHPNSDLLTDIKTQASQLGLSVEPTVNGNGNGNGNGHTSNTDGWQHTTTWLAALSHELIQVEQRMIPLGLHILGMQPKQDELIDILVLVASFNPPLHPRTGEKLPALPSLIARGLGEDYETLRETIKIDSIAQEKWEEIDAILKTSMELFVELPRIPDLDTNHLDKYLAEKAGIPDGLLANFWVWLDNLLSRIIHDEELSAIIKALNGGYITPSPGNDVIRNEAIVPTGKNIHALDPYRIPNSVSISAAKKLVDQMLENLTIEQGKLPETVAMVLWGTDNLKSDGEGIAQCLYLLGTHPIEDELGNISNVELIPLEELGRPRIDVVMTLSGIFRDLFHHQAGLLDKAVRLAAAADEPLEMNYVRKHTLAHVQETGIDFDTATARVFSNAPGAYGAQVNHLVDSSTWDEDEQLSEMFLTRKSYAYRPGGKWQAARQVMERSFSTVDAAFQNIDSFELGISDVDHYYEYLGGVTKSVENLRGKRPDVLVADAVATHDRLSSLEQMVRIESRAKMLNPKWYDAMLSHGYEGVREIEVRVSNTFGWSATAEAVGDWVYDDIADTFLLDEVMRQRMAEANPHATAGIARRLLEAQSRGFWDASDELLDQLREIYGNLEDQLEGVYVG